ncbi:MAG: ABC transporter ATP-binding protein, partial [Acidobacteriota bacterium]
DVSKPADRALLEGAPAHPVAAGDKTKVYVRTDDLSKSARATLEARGLIAGRGFVLPAALAGGKARFVTQDKFVKLPKGVQQRIRAPDRRGVIHLALYYILLLVINFFLSYGVTMGLNHLGQRAVYRIRGDLWRKLHRLPVRYFDENPVGRLVTRVTNDTATLSDLFDSVLATATSDVTLFVGILLVLFFLDAGLTLRLFLLAPPLILLSLWFKRVSQKIYRIVRVQMARLNTFLQEAVSGMVVIKSFVHEAVSTRQFARINDAFYHTQLRLIYIYAVFRPLIDAFATSAIALVVWFAGSQILGRQLSVGTLVAFLLYLRMLFMPLQDLAEKFNILQSSVVASERLFAILDRPDQNPGKGRTTPSADPQIVFDHVSFAYDEGNPVLKDVSFRVPRGKTVALVGPTGSGKTTIVSLLLRLYDLERNHGRILVDGLPLREWDMDALRRRFSLVQQDLFLFSGSLEHNITLFDGGSGHRPEDLKRILEMSRLEKVIHKLPDGLAHELNERGPVLSQGERQIVSFARALAHKGEILILDEATASVDSQTEMLIQQALQDLLKDRTAIIIAHRLSTIQEADLILVLKKGRIVEQGNHDELLSAGGLYAHLYRTHFAPEAARAAKRERTG